jgi:hypothetical protein
LSEIGGVAKVAVAIMALAVAGWQWGDKWQWLGGSGGDCGHFDTDFVIIGALLSKLSQCGSGSNSGSGSGSGKSGSGSGNT